MKALILVSITQAFAVGLLGLVAFALAEVTAKAIRRGGGALRPTAIRLVHAA